MLLRSLVVVALSASPVFAQPTLADLADLQARVKALTPAELKVYNHMSGVWANLLVLEQCALDYPSLITGQRVYDLEQKARHLLNELEPSIGELIVMDSVAYMRTIPMDVRRAECPVAVETLGYAGVR